MIDIDLDPQKLKEMYDACKYIRMSAAPPLGFRFVRVGETVECGDMTLTQGHDGVSFYRPTLPCWWGKSHPDDGRVRIRELKETKQ